LPVDGVDKVDGVDGVDSMDGGNGLVHSVHSVHAVQFVRSVHTVGSTYGPRLLPDKILVITTIHHDHARIDHRGNSRCMRLGVIG